MSTSASQAHGTGKRSDHRRRRRRRCREPHQRKSGSHSLTHTHTYGRSHTFAQVEMYIPCRCQRRRRCPSQEADLEPVCRIFTKTEFSLEAFGGVEGVCKSAIRCLSSGSATIAYHRERYRLHSTDYRLETTHCMESEPLTLLT